MNGINQNVKLLKNFVFEYIFERNLLPPNFLSYEFKRNWLNFKVDSAYDVRWHAVVVRFDYHTRLILFVDSDACTSFFVLLRLKVFFYSSGIVCRVGEF